MKRIILFLFLSCFISRAQEYFPNNDDITNNDVVITVIKNATIVTKPGTIINNGTIIIKKGRIHNIGSNLSIPAGAIVYDADGNYIYPSFIEPYSDFGMQKSKRTTARGQQYDESRKGYYWNDHIRAEQDALDYYKYDNKTAESLINAGYGSVQTHLSDGIARGNGLLIALNNNGNDASRILKKESGNFFSLTRSVQTRQSYPTSLMGALALLRQVHYDAKWYDNGHSTTRDLTLESLIANKNLVQIIEAGNKKNVLRVDKLGDKFGKQFVIVGGDDAYEMIDEIKATNASLILPINFPDAYDVTNPYQEWFVNLADMREWKQAPANPYVLSQANVAYAFTSKGLKSPDKVMGKIKTAMEYGLTADQALAALTLQPAQILGIDDMVGTLEKGKVANFIMTSGVLFEKDTKLYENWIQGSKHIINDRLVKDADGTYTTLLNGDNYTFTIKNNAKKVEVAIDTIKLKSIINFDKKWINITSTQKDNSTQEYTRFLGTIDDNGNYTGDAYLPDGSKQPFTAVKNQDKKDEKTERTESTRKEIGAITYPNVSYGNPTKPQEETILYRNATVWTNEKDGVLENTDVLVKNGKISKIGKNLSASNARVIDATGKHLTSGIIDEHSHIAIDNGVNEAGHNSSAEVTIEDVVDHEDINIYRNLAGGVTTSQLLHGSANPIGGRSAIIKLKWGYTAQEMIYDDSPQFIKFALGENVKQSRYQNGIRFPQTRMGVEQVFEDYFTRAREYEKTKGSNNFRHDEEMEVILEILKGERFVSCHSYVQSEINMLMKVAEKHGFRINTFTHILEGYKVADKMREHGVGGSTFSDWWAYKYEVNDAIPYNAAIMHSQGVVTAINSDDAEMSRRLNQEAAKAIKYGGVSEQDAWKMVTLNPAKLLHIDNRTGSIKTGKDADLVLWSGNPLSVNSKAEITMIDGIVFFDKERDIRFRESIIKERQLLINEMIAAKNKGLKTQTPKQTTKTLYECNTLEW